MTPQRRKRGWMMTLMATRTFTYTSSKIGRLVHLYIDRTWVALVYKLSINPLGRILLPQDRQHFKNTLNFLIS